jgi:hypothetical protein
MVVTVTAMAAIWAGAATVIITDGDEAAAIITAGTIITIDHVSQF